MTSPGLITVQSPPFVVDRILGVIPLFLHPSHPQFAPGLILGFWGQKPNFDSDYRPVGQIERPVEFDFAVSVYASDGHVEPGLSVEGAPSGWSPLRSAGDTTIMTRETKSHKASRRARSWFCS